MRSDVANLTPIGAPAIREPIPQLQRHLRWADDRCAGALRTGELSPRLKGLLVSIDRHHIGPGMAQRT